MLHLDVTAALAKAITPSMGIPDQEFAALRTGMKRYVEDFLKERRAGEHGWSMNAYDKAAAQKVKEMAMTVKGRGIKTVVWIGIGGSGLGPRVLAEAFETIDGLEFLVIDTIDPFVLETSLKALDWKSTLLVPVSKSGDTLETMSAFLLFYDQLQRQKKIRPAQHVVAITDPEKGYLREFCIEHGITMLPLPSDVGGRYSIFTPIFSMRKHTSWTW